MLSEKRKSYSILTKQTDAYKKNSIVLHLVPDIRSSFYKKKNILINVGFNLIWGLI